MKQPIMVGLLGLGTVGGGTLRILQNRVEDIAQRLGRPVQVKKVLVRNLQKPRPVVVDPALLTDNPADILEDPEISIVVELMGGIHPALDYIKSALKAGKNVVTANKDLMAVHGRELFELADAKELDLEFEASVAGGIPIIRPLKVCLTANRIEELKGIINGTTNFILTKMTQEGSDFGEVLKEAQALGYAEADPTADVEGLDAARKLAILASIAFNSRITLNDVYVEGITKVTARDIQYARQMGYTIKLLGIAKEIEGKVEARVHPAMIPDCHPLAAVNDAFNAIFVKGDAVGETMFYGRGAGDMPTGSAVVGDIIDVARNIINGHTGRISCTCYHQKPVRPIGEIVCKYFLRLVVTEKPGVLASIAGVFGDQGVSIQTLIQQETIGDSAEIVLVTHPVQEDNLQKALNILSDMPIVERVGSVIRVERG
ncbi:homoserine dehydrogenase [Heliobacterium undosum]|uniref:Homoserine dehydrogenase n=1 Tax=Heliomicrobium undosum TaxID=121734 RepID=A0A845KXA1_9FIRM|nr:homoserine dehydrogenase [Heliomicrobium undosum]MZP28132.1 homoserine dehydrogenase [Heliomicrobium undosum]